MLPDVPAVDRVFDYLIPDELDARVHVGTIVRVPLHGRRVRGWVMDRDVEPDAALEKLLPLTAVVSAGPPRDVLDLCGWAAWRWTGPRPAFLRAASPPNVVADTAAPEVDVAVFPPVPAPIDLPLGRQRVIRWPPSKSRIDLVRALVASEGSTILVVPDADESHHLAAALDAEGRTVLSFRSDEPDASRTSAWDEARRGACVAIGGRVVAWAPVPDLAAVIVLDDLDEALEEERSPTWEATAVAIERARRHSAQVSVVSPAPGAQVRVLEAAMAGPPRPVEREGWPRLQVIDVRSEAPGNTLLSSALADGLRNAIDSNGRAVCVLNRRGRARLLVCPKCGELARCPRCEAAFQESTDGLACPRCETRGTTVCTTCGHAGLRRRRLGVVGLRDHIAALVPKARVIAVEGGSAPLPAFDVAIGTEAALHRVPADGHRPVRLVAFLDIDQELLAPRYRAEEQAIWLLVRAARLVGAYSDGGVVLVQTRMPGHPVLTAVASGDPTAALEQDLARRRALAYPPFGGLAEVSGVATAVDAACALLDRVDGVSVVGPSDGRALVRTPTIDELCDTLAAVDLGPARALGRLRVDVDPRRV